MYDNITGVLEILKYTVGAGFGYAMLIGLVSWGIWVAVGVFRNASNG